MRSSRSSAEVAIVLDIRSLLWGWWDIEIVGLLGVEAVAIIC